MSKTKKIRISQITDAQAFIDIKNKLPISNSEDETTTGGFLLGTNIETYRFYIEQAFCLSLVNDEAVLGFGIVLKDAMVKQSELWEKRKLVDWTIDISAIESKKICYFEQLAFLKGNGQYSIAVAYRLLCKAFETHDVLLTTTVEKPISNLAAVPYILGVGGKKIGSIDEIYPEVGDINSNVFMVTKADFYKYAKASSLYRFVEARRFKF
jgi:hypothetical protein